jgi:predicted DNA-binding protein (UPF0251 family)
MIMCLCTEIYKSIAQHKKPKYLKNPKRHILQEKQQKMYRRRNRCGRRGRFPKPVTLSRIPPTNVFNPDPSKNLEAIFLEVAELEAFRLVDMEGLSQEEAGKQMGVSRGTIWRLVQSARKKAAQALSEGRSIYIAAQGKGGQVDNQTR